MSRGRLMLLDQWAGQYGDLWIALEQHCGGLSDEELDTLESATNLATQTNCWWAVYRVAPMVKDAVRAERMKRKRADNKTLCQAEGTSRDDL